MDDLGDWQVLERSGGVHGHIVNHVKHPHLNSDSTLHVIGVISNPVRYHARYRLFREWYARMKRTPNVKVYVVEIAFGDRQHEVTEKGNPCHLQLRTKQELWHKENMINLAVRHLLPRDWKYMCWSDTDVFWPDNADGTPFNWPLETIHQLQHYPVVQPWKDCIDQGFYGDVMLDKLYRPLVHTSFCFVHQLGIPKQTNPCEPYKYAHSGFAWACTRQFWENIAPIGGLMAWCLVGSADHHMAFAMIGEVHKSVHGGMSDGFKRKAKEWQDRAFAVTQGNLGFVKVLMRHGFHGPKPKRYYRERWGLFIEYEFDPEKDIYFDEQGLICLNGKPLLAQGMQKYNRSRSEDSIDD